MLTKAAAFYKPVIVASGQCMGKRVELYQTGIAINELDKRGCAKAIAELCKIQIDRNNYKQYTTMHRTETLKDCLSILTYKIS